MTVIDDFESSDEEYEESEEFLQIAPDVKEQMKSKHAELISSAIMKSMLVCVHVCGVCGGCFVWAYGCVCMCVGCMRWVCV